MGFAYVRLQDIVMLIMIWTDLEAQLIEASNQNHRFKIIVTDGVFLHGRNRSTIG